MVVCGMFHFSRSKQKSVNVYYVDKLVTWRLGVVLFGNKMGQNGHFPLNNYWK